MREVGWRKVGKAWTVDDQCHVDAQKIALQLGSKGRRKHPYRRGPGIFCIKSMCVHCH